MSNRWNKMKYKDKFVFIYIIHYFFYDLHWPSKFLVYVACLWIKMPIMMKLKSQPHHITRINNWKASGSGNPPTLILAFWNIDILLHKQAAWTKYFATMNWYVLLCRKNWQTAQARLSMIPSLVYVSCIWIAQQAVPR